MALKIDTVKDLLFWSYSNLAMAHAAVSSGLQNYNKTSFMIRSRIFKGLVSGTMSIGSMFDDEKFKIINSDRCAYCGTKADVSIDHIIPRYSGGDDSASNLIRACKHCNSSKGKKDLMEWYNDKNEFPPILLLRRYLKIVYIYCCNENILYCKLDQINKDSIPFQLNSIPTEYPQPSDLILYK